VIQDLSGSWYIEGTGESMTRVDLPVPLMHHDPDRSWITDPDLDQSKGRQPICFTISPARLGPINRFMRTLARVAKDVKSSNTSA